MPLAVVLAALSGATLIPVLIWLLVIAGIAAVVWWAIGALGLPQPVRIIAIVIFAVVGILVLAQLLPPFPLG